MILKGDDKMESVAVRGISCNKSEAKITVCEVPDKPGVAAKLFSAISNVGVNVDTIVQNVSHTRRADISFTVPRAHLKRALTAVKAAAKKIGGGNVLFDKNIARVSIVGSGMRSYPGVAAKMFRIFAENGINIEMITTSEISISCLINRKHTDLAIRASHKKFHLEQM